METVFVLQHSYEIDFCDETKLIGVYATSEAAESAISRLKTQPGFRNRESGFDISAYEIDKDHWAEGFIPAAWIEVKDKDENWITIEAELLSDGNYQIVEQPDINSI